MAASGASGRSDHSNGAFVSGWEDAMNEVIENEYSEHASRATAARGNFVEVGTPEDLPVNSEDALPAIIQSTTVDSTPLIQLESTESATGSINKEEREKGDGEENPWLDLAASSSSKGSYADQVPAISGSGSLNDPFDMIGLDTQEEKEAPTVHTASSPSQNTSVSPIVSPTYMSFQEAPTDEASTVFSGYRSVTKHTTDALYGAVAPILESKETMEDILGPNDDRSTFFSAKESGDPRSVFLKNDDVFEDILGAKEDFRVQSTRTSNNEIELGSPKSNKGIEYSEHEVTVTSTDEQKDKTLGLIVESLGNHQRLQTRPERSQPGRLMIGPKNSNASQDSTDESRSSHLKDEASAISEQGSSWSDEKMHPGSVDSVSHNESISVATSFSRDETFSSRPGGSFSPPSHNESLFSGTSLLQHVSMSNTTNTLSRDESLTAGGRSVFSGYTSYTGYTGYTDQTGYTEMSETEGSTTAHTRASETKSPTANESSGTGFFSARTRGTTEHSRTSIGQAMPEKTGDESSGVQITASRAQSSDYDDSCAPAGSRPAKQQSPFTQSLMARMRSRANPSALSQTSSNAATEHPTMIRVGEEKDEQFIVNTAFARKRVSVVQLLIVGLFSILVCVFGSIWIQSSCHYVSAKVQVGESQEMFTLHYGLWRYTPIGSAFQGYTYCNTYHENYSADPPLLPRYASLLASVGGAFAVCVLWNYLIFGRSTRVAWDAAVNGAVFSGILHGVSLLIFITPPCVETECQLGPAGAASVAASIVNFILAFEMYYNSPIKSWMDDVPNCSSSEHPRQMMQTLEMADFQAGASAYCRRIISAPSGDIPTLNQIQRNNEDPLGEAMLDRDISNGVYAPPTIV